MRNAILVYVLFLALLLGSLFLFSVNRFHLFELYRKYWTIYFGLITLLVCLLVPSRMKPSVEKSLKIFILVGIFEIAYAMLQLLDVIPVYNRYFSYTGSFDNPAIYSMYLTFCSLYSLCLYYSNCNYRKAWLWIYLLFVLMIVMSESRTGMVTVIVSFIYICYSRNPSLHVFLAIRRNKYMLSLLLILFFVIMYILKRDSANGRLLIWRVCMDMIADRPLLGFGHGGFLAYYMKYQAEYLSSHPGSPLAMLADNVSHPFNEFLHLAVNYGLVGIFIFVTIVVVSFKRINSLSSINKLVLKGSILVLLLWCFFSYPFEIPFIWIITSILLVVNIQNLLTSYSNLHRYLMTCMYMLLLVKTSVHFVAERKWKELEYQSLTCNKETVLKDYRSIYPRLSKNGYFLYNYGAELHHYGHYDESIMVLGECSKKLNDYDVQMLLGSCYQQIGDTLTAIKYYDNASEMIPSKFLPLYYKMQLYFESGDSISARHIAEQIVHKNVKIKESKSVQQIKDTAQILLNGNI